MCLRRRGAAEKGEERGMFRRIAAICGAVGLIAAVAACGSSSSSSGGGNSNKGSASDLKSATAIKPGKQGGKLTMLTSGDIDYLDPGQDYYTFGYQVQYAINRTLYSFKPDNSETPIPDLATGPPQISKDNKTITVHIKPNIKYAPPVNRVVTTKDIKYAFDRAFSKNVPSGYACTYFSSIVGTPQAGVGPIKPISGIQTPNDTTIVFHLKSPNAPLVSQALVMPITTPVPEEYAKPFDAKLPSTYDSYVAFIGPYMVKNDPKTGKVVGRVPGKSIDIVRNPNWVKSTDYRHAYLDEIFIQEANNDMASAAPGPQAGHTARSEPGALHPRGRHALHLVQHDRRAVQQHQHPQGDHRGLRPQRPAPDGRRRDHRPDRDGLHPARHPRLRRGRRPQAGHRPGLPGPPAGRPGGGQEVHAAGQEAGREPADQLQRPVDRQRQDPDHRHQRRPGQEDRRGLPEPDGQARVQPQPARGPAGHAVHEVLRRAQAGRGDLPERRMVQGLLRPPVDARRHLQRQEHPPAVQR